MNSGRAIGALAAIAVVALGVWLMVPEDRPMPTVTFNLTDGGTLHSDELRGKSVLVNFWSVSCEICMRDMPRLKAMQANLAEQNFSIIGVAMSHDPPPAVIATVDGLQPGYPIALDVHGEIGRVFGDVRVTPTTFLIDPLGNIRYSARGPLDETRIRATLLSF